MKPYVNRGVPCPKGFPDDGRTIGLMLYHNASPSCSPIFRLCPIDHSE